jgi:predicted outer membrane repeat protein
MPSTFRPASILTSLAVTAAWVAPAVAGTATINVPSAQAPTIQVAINLAADGDEIVVAPGTYFTKLDFIGKTLTLRSSGGPQVTFIDAIGQLDPVIKLISGEGPETLIDGFTLRNGLANNSSPNDRGGGIYCNLTSPTIRNCILTQNTAGFGGGLFVLTGNPVIENCQFIDNQATNSGGAMYFGSNSNCTVTNCSFTQNAANLGGALYASTTSFVIADCDFIDNEATQDGGAVELTVSAAIRRFERCLFRLNTSGGEGGAAMVVTSTGASMWLNCVFDRNDAGLNGGGFSIWDASQAVLHNCTFNDNNTTGGGGGGAIYKEGTANLQVHNCIAWNNTPNQLNAGIIATYCNIEGGYVGAGNIGANPSHDPLFIDAANGDLRLQSASPCIDAGSTVLLATNIATDFDGAARVVNGLPSGPTGQPAYGYYVDMGAFEFQPAVGGPNPCPPDVNLSGAVDADDLVAVILGWGQCP